MQGYPDLSKTSLTNYSANFVPHFYVNYFFEAFEIFEVKDVIEFVVRSHVQIYCFHFTNVVNPTVLP